MSGEEQVAPKDERDAPETVSVTAVVPNLSAEEAAVRVDPETDVTDDDVGFVGYPKFLFDYECSLERVFLGDRTVSLSITVDAIGGGRLRNDVYPDLETRRVPKDALLRPRFTRDDAAENARSVLRKYLSFHYPSYMLLSGMPDTEVANENFVYGLYWVVPETADGTASQNVSLVNAISGEIIEEDLPVDQTKRS